MCLTFHKGVIMTAFTIEKNIDIPAPRSGAYGQAKYPFRKMRAGDSFLLKPNGDGKKGLERARVMVLLEAKKYKVKVTTRTVPGGVRVWKIQ